MMARRILPVILLLILHAGILLHGVWHKSSSVDELGHLAAGLYSLHNNDFRCNRLSPPLQNIVCALPVIVFGEYRLTYDHACWKQGIWNGLGERFVEANPQTFHRNLMIARSGTIALSVALCYLIYRWSRELWGVGAALCVLFLAILEPNILAHGRLATADTAPSLFFLLTGYTAWHFSRKPTWTRLILVGVFFGFTWASKHSGVILIPALFLVFVILGWRYAQPIGFRGLARFRRIPHRLFPIWGALGLMGIVLTSGLFAIWMCYGFEMGDKIDPPRPPKSSLLWTNTHFPLLVGAYFMRLNDRFPFDPNNADEPFWRLLRRWLPAFSHWEGFFANRLNATRGSPAFFLGETSYRTKLAYFPVLFLVKTPLPLLILVLVGAIVLLSGQSKLDTPGMIVGLLIPAVYLFFLVFFNRAYIGYRHALPAVPFMLVFLAGAACRSMIWNLGNGRRKSVERSQKLVGRFLLAGILLWLAAGVLCVHPHYLTYYNTLAGGPDNGHLIAVDSNFDWGQDLLYLKDYLEERNIPDAYLIYFGPKLMPKAYGVPHRDYVSQKTLQPGIYIISATMLRQYIASYYLPELVPLASRMPDDVVAHTMFVYNLNP